MFKRSSKALLVALALGALPARGGEAKFDEIDEPPHLYKQRTPTDRFSRLKSELESARAPLDNSGEKAFVISLLKFLGIPASSQMLVFSTTSLQLSLISPSTPRALYFSDDLYLGYVLGGRIEIAALDPDLGTVFYIFDIPKSGRPIQLERSGRCMNCHADENTGHVPGLVVKSVVPGRLGGSLTAFRLEQSGHGIPLADRLGGYYVTGANGYTNHWGNLIGRYGDAGMERDMIEPGARFDFSRFPVQTSDFLAHLLHEHQVGFVNRVVEAAYKTRTALFNGGGKLSAADETEVEKQAETIVRYLLFKDEAPLPTGGVAGDSAFKADFAATRKAASNGASLRDLDLTQRLLKHRCSYMIYSPVFEGLPAQMKSRVFRRLKTALDTSRPDPEFAYLPNTEKTIIRQILRETLTGFSSGGG